MEAATATIALARRTQGGSGGGVRSARYPGGGGAGGGRSRAMDRQAPSPASGRWPPKTQGRAGRRSRQSRPPAGCRRRAVPHGGGRRRGERRRSQPEARFRGADPDRAPGRGHAGVGAHRAVVAARQRRTLRPRPGLASRHRRPSARAVGRGPQGGRLGRRDDGRCAGVRLHAAFCPYRRGDDRREHPRRTGAPGRRHRREPSLSGQGNFPAISSTSRLAISRSARYLSEQRARRVRHGVGDDGAFGQFQLDTGSDRIAGNVEQPGRQQPALVGRQSAVAAVRRLGQRVADTGAQPGSSRVSLIPSFIAITSAAFDVF